MAAIEVAPLPAHLSVPELWPEVARQCSHWLAQASLPARDAVLLVPYAALLPHARAAFAQRGGWQPRIETPLTLAASLAPTHAAASGELTGDAVADRLAAAAMLKNQGWARDWQRRDARGFDHLAARVAIAAQQLARAAAATAPVQRAAYWTQQRSGVAGAVGGSTLEAALLHVAVEWAALGSPVATDELFALKPSAWIALRIGGADALTESVLAAAPCPALLIDADTPGDDPFTAFAMPGHALRLQSVVCDSVEAEVQAAAGAVIEALNAGHHPVAVVVLDRELARRLRAALQRTGASIADETGWRLSTTPAAARVMATLRAAAPHARPEDWLAWLKCELPKASTMPWLLDLEALWRRARTMPGAVAQALALSQWHGQRVRLAGLSEMAARQGNPPSLHDWLKCLRAHLGEPSTVAVALGDAALVRIALRLDDVGVAWRDATRAIAMTLPDFIAWVDEVLDAANLEPPREADADVVLTPLARAIGRPFAQVVVPGADATRLGAISLTPSLISESLAHRLGLATAAARQMRERLALAQLLRLPQLRFVRRRLDADTPVGASPLLQWLAASLAVHGQALTEAAWQAPGQACVLTPPSRPQPSAPTQLPPFLSASSVSALRECPYRFYAKSVLRLDQREEIDAPLEKREYGIWLHLALQHFHERRLVAANADELDALLRCATQAAAELALDSADLLPFHASFAVFAPAYIAWMQARESRGLVWHSGETDFVAAPPALAPQQLRGRIDRIDRGPGGVIEVIDYKTGSTAALKARMVNPLEDTQLPFYAALVMDGEPQTGAVAASYLALDDAASPVEVPHRNVGASAAAMLDGLAVDFEHLRAGAAMPALGEGRVCEFCEMRGLCRRDHWPALLQP